jgi:hypothetical protein
MFRENIARMNLRAHVFLAVLAAALLPAGIAAGSGSVPIDSGLIANGAGASLAGQSVAVAGDVNGDGVQDVIVGDPGFDYDGKTDAGAAWVLFGPVGAGEVLSLPALPAGRGFRIAGNASDTAVGYSVAAAGDVNGDGIDDVIVGTWRRPEGGFGRSVGVVVFGSRSPADFIVTPTVPAGRGFYVRPLPSNFTDPAVVAGLGDVNGDGRDDVGVATVNTSNGGSCPTGTAPRDCRGTTMVVFGKTDGSQVSADSPAFADQGFLVHGPQSGRRAGMSLASVGDLDRDGLDDFAIAGWGNYIGGNPGNVWVVRGKQTTGTVDLPSVTANSTVPYVLTGLNNNFRIGASLARAGDVNGDGREDLVVGAPQADLNSNTNFEGIAAVAFLPAGQRTELLDPLDFDGFAIRTSVDGPEGLGAGVAAAGDVDGDGLADVAVGAPGAVSNPGRVHVVLGSASRQAVTVEAPGPRGYTLTGVVAGARTGATLGGGRDLNGDGRPDLIAGAWTEPGRAYVPIRTPLPLVQAANATGVASRSAVLRASVTPSLVGASARIEYGPAGTFGSTAGPVNVSLGGLTPLEFPVSGLQPSTTYSFRAVATSIHGTSRGPVRSFTTPPDPVDGTSPPPGTPPPGSTPDTRAPLARIAPPVCRLKPRSRCPRFLTTAAAWRTLRGTVADPAPSSGIARVQVNLVSKVGRSCRVLVGRRLVKRSCAKARATWVAARLNSTRRGWSLGVPALPPGVYLARARAVDRAGNVQRVFPKASVRTITIRA